MSAGGRARFDSYILPSLHPQFKLSPEAITIKFNWQALVADSVHETALDNPQPVSFVGDGVALPVLCESCARSGANE